MKYYVEPKRKIPVVAEVDILVLGAGPAGVAAAVSAAREGVSVMLVEQLGTVGGMSTSGLMSHWTGNTQGGFFEEILTRSADLEDTESYGFNGSPRQIINSERLKTEYLNMLDEARVTLCLYTFFSDVIMQDGKVVGAILESKSGREAVYSKITIDCTGDGDAAAKSGVEFILGREEDGAMQPATIMFKVGGVNYKQAVFPGKFEDHIQIPEGDIQKLGEDNLPQPAGHVLLYRTSLPGVVTCNMTNCTGIDGTNMKDLVRATLVCRNQIEPIVEFLRQHVPGYQNCYLIDSGDFLGIRETRHFKGVKTITEKDIESARVFPDWVVTKAAFNFDIHNMTGNGLDATGVQDEFVQSKGYTIPYGCLVPDKMDGLLLAGRCISGTHMAHANFRAMPICANMGQAAGIAAALCVKENQQPRDGVVS